MDFNVAARSEFESGSIPTRHSPEATCIMELCSSHDPVIILPWELVYLILSYLDASSVIKAMYVSKTWMIYGLYPELWRKLYMQEGWRFHDSSDEGHSLLVKKSTMASKLPRSYSLAPDWHGRFVLRKRLEENWKAGRFVKFQLPHPNHADEGHTSDVYAIHSSGGYLVSGGRDTTIRIWNLDTQRLERKPLQGHLKSVLCLQCDAQRQEDVIISGGEDALVIVWVFSSGKTVKRIEGAHGAPVLSLGFNQQFLVTSSEDTTIKVWNRQDIATTGNSKPLPAYSVLRTLRGHSYAVNTIQIHEDQIVSASGDCTIRLWNMHTGACLRKFTLTRSVACVQFDGQRIVSGSRDNSVRIFDCRSGSELACLDGHRDLVRSVQGLTDGRSLGIIVSGSYDGSIVLWRKEAKGNWVLRHENLRSEAVPSRVGLERALEPARSGAVSSRQDGYTTKIFRIHIINGRMIVCGSQQGIIEGWDFAAWR